MNLPTAIVALIVLAVFVAIVARSIRNHKEGKYDCSGDCSHCGNACSSGMTGKSK